MSDSQQVKFLAGLKLDLANKASQSGLTPGALYFCTDEKKIFKATANNAYEAVNEEVSFGVLPEAAKAFPGKLYLRQSDMTLHVLNEAGDAFKQLSAPANALTPDKVSEDLEADDKKLLASKAAVKAGIKVVADKLADEITNRTTGDTQTLANAKKYADDQDKILAGDYNTAGEGQESNASGLRKEIEERIAAEAKLRSDADKGLAGRLDTIEGEGKGSIKAAVKAEKERAEAAEKVLTDNLADEVSARTTADTALDTRITKLEGDANTPGSVASQIKEVKDQIKDIKDTVGHAAVEADEGQGIEAQDATGLFAKLDEEKARAEAAEKANAAAIKAEETRATTKEEANAKAIADEATRAKAAEKANADAIATLNGDENTEGSVAKAVKDAVDTEATTRETKDNELKAAIDKINKDLGLGEGATGGLGVRLSTLESEMDAVEGRADALEGRATALEGRADNLEAAVNVLKGNAETEGSVAKAVKDAVDAEKSAREQADNLLDGRLDVIEASIGTGGDLEKRVKKNEDDIKVINGEGEGSIKKAVADLVDGAPETLDTLNELAGALRDNADVLSAIETAFDKKLADLQKDVDQNEADCDAAIAAEKTRAEGIEAKLRTDVNSKVAQSDYNTKVAALEKADADNLAAAKKYTDDQIGKYNTAAEGEPSNASGLKGEIETKIAAEKTARVEADTALQGQINDINDTLGLGGATGSVGDRLSNLETAVGTKKEGEKEATGLYKDIDDLKATDTALGGRLTSLESVVGNAESGLVKKVNDNAAAIEIINGGEAQEGSIAKALKDAKDYTDGKVGNLNDLDTTAKDSAVLAINELKGNIDAINNVDNGILKQAKNYTDTEVGKVSNKVGNLDDLGTTAKGSAVLAINELKGDIDEINNSLGLGEGATGGLGVRLNQLESVVGDAKSGLVKDVADNAAAISDNADAIAIINGDKTQDGSIAKALEDAKTDATTKANAAKDAAIAKAEELDTALETSLQGYADQAQADAEKEAARLDGILKTELENYADQAEADAKAYTDTALTWGSF